MESSPVIRARSLAKRYGPLLAVDGVDLAVARGERVALLGPDGAGKSSMLRMLYGRTVPSSGEIEIFGLPLARRARRIKRRIGVLPQHDDLDEGFSVLENLTLHGSCHGLRGRESRRRAAELLGFLEIEDRRGARVADLPRGVRRRLMMARALIHAPELLLLDEPASTLEREARLAVWERLLAVGRSGTTILVATRSAPEAEALATRVLVTDHGRILDGGSPEELIARHAPGEIAEIEGAPREAAAAVAEAGLRHEAAGERLRVYPPDERAGAWIRELCARMPARRTVMRRGTLEDVFLRLAGRALPDGADDA